MHHVRQILMCLGAAFAVAGCQALDTLTVPDDWTPPAATTEPDDVHVAMLDEAAGAVEEGRYDEALVIFQEILRDNPTITTAYLGIGRIYLVKQDYASAEPAFARAARLEPRSFDAQFNHGLSLQMLERWIDAVRAYQRALTIRPESSEANLNLALTYLHLADTRRALTFAQAAVDADPSNGPAQANLGAICEELELWRDAIDAYIAAIELMGNEPPLLMNLINVLSKESRYREAANTAGALVRIEPSATAWERLGWCTFKLHEYDRSVEAYKEAIELDPRHWPALNGVAVNALNRWLLSDGRDVEAFEEAREHFRRSVRARPDQPKVVELMLRYEM